MHRIGGLPRSAFAALKSHIDRCPPRTYRICGFLWFSVLDNVRHFTALAPVHSRTSHPSNISVPLDEASSELISMLGLTAESALGAARCWESPCSLSTDCKDELLFMRLLTEAFAGGDEATISAIMDITYKIPHVARSIGFRKLLELCVSQFTCADGSRQRWRIEESYIEHSVCWLQNMTVDARTQNINDIILIAESCDSIYMLRFTKLFFGALHQRRLMYKGPHDGPDAAGHSGSCIVKTFQALRRSSGAHHSFSFLKKMIRRGIWYRMNVLM